jgi:hypothetical protein
MNKYFQKSFITIWHVKLVAKFITCIVILILPFTCLSQHFIKVWTVQSESEQWELSSDFTIADSNTIYISGNYNGNSKIISIDSKNANPKSSGVKITTTKSTDLKKDQNVFIARLNSKGSLEWVKYFIATGYTHISTIKASNNAIYIAGYFHKDLDLGEKKLRANNHISAFVAKLDLSGTVIWAKQIAGDFNGQKLFVLPFEKNNAIIAGSFTHTICLLDTINRPKSFGTNIFAAILDSCGTVTKNIISISNGKCVLNNVIADKYGNIYFGGSFENYFTISNKSMQSVGKEDGFIYCFNKELEPVYTKQIGSIYDDNIQSIVFDNQNNLIATGGYNEEITTLGIKFPAVIGNTDVFVIKFAEFGNPVWSDGFGSKANDYATSVTTNKSGKIFVSGSTRGAIKKGNFGTVPNNPGSNLFIAKYTSDGALRLIDTIGADRTNFNRKIEIDSEGYLLMSGNFHETTLDNKGKIQKNKPDNFHLTKLFDCDSQKTIQLPADTTICGTSISITADSSFLIYKWNVGSKTNHITVDTTGTYILMITDKFGCTSSDTIHVNINQLPAFSLGDTIYLAAHESYTFWGPPNMHQYQWSDKSTLPNLTLPKNANYPLIVSLKVKDEKGCETTKKATVFRKGMQAEDNSKRNTNDTKYTVEMYPNPILENLTIDILNIDNKEKVIFKVIALDGKLLTSKNLLTYSNSVHQVISLSFLPRGTYNVEIVNGNNVVNRTVIKQ